MIQLGLYLHLNYINSVRALHLVSEDPIYYTKLTYIDGNREIYSFLRIVYCTSINYLTKNLELRD